jgi:hypothetical protein
MATAKSEFLRAMQASKKQEDSSADSQSETQEETSKTQQKSASFSARDAFVRAASQEQEESQEEETQQKSASFSARDAFVRAASQEQEEQEDSEEEEETQKTSAQDSEEEQEGGQQKSARDIFARALVSNEDEQEEDTQDSEEEEETQQKESSLNAREAFVKAASMNRSAKVRSAFVQALTAAEEQMEVITEEDFENLSDEDKKSWKGYFYSMAFEVVTPESAEEGEVADSGWEDEESSTYDYLEELLKDTPIKQEHWVEWSSTSPDSKDYLISEDEFNPKSDESKRFHLWIKRKDGKALSKSELKAIDKTLRLK